MFSDKKEKEIIDPVTGQNRINEGTNIKGDIHSKGFFRIDGTIEGNVSTPSKVVLGKTGYIKGTLMCENADIEGRFEGKLDVTGTLSLRSTAQIDGEVIIGKLSVEPGANFNASCIMKGSKRADGDNPMVQIFDDKNLKSLNHPFDRAQRLQKKAEQST